MFAALTENSLTGIQVVREFIARHEELQIGRKPSARLEMKRYSVSSCVTRLYAIYENFVETLVSDYLDVIPELCRFADLSESMRKEYRIGISHLLSRLDGLRYGHLDHANLIRWYHEAVAAHSPYRFIPEALTRHDENLRLSVLAAMLKRVQIEDLPGWLSHHESITALFTESAAMIDQIESELQNFIQLRNDAAHGGLATLPGNETLQRYCDLVGALVSALSSLLHREAILWRHRVGKARLIGQVTEVFQQANAFIVPLAPGRYIALNESVHIIGPWSCIEAHINSIEVDSQPADGIGAFSATIEIGIQASMLPRRHVELYADS
jgi:hypothetical protein